MKLISELMKVSAALKVSLIVHAMVPALMPTLMPTLMLALMLADTGTANAQTPLSSSSHPDPTAGLAVPAGACFEKNMNGPLVAKAMTPHACAAHPVPSVWVQGKRVVSFGRVKPANVATGKNSIVKKAPL